MTELKTLKDIFPVHNTDESYQEYDDILRAEAIKWIKNYQAGIEWHDNMALKKCISFESSQILNAQLSARIDFIKHFFNITEEELK